MKQEIFYSVPYSELAMNMKIAGKPVVDWQVIGQGALVWVKNESQPYAGLISEIIPFELRLTGKDYQ